MKKLLVLLSLCLPFFSCKTVTMVSYANENFQYFEKNGKFKEEKNFGDKYLFSEIIDLVNASGEGYIIILHAFSEQDFNLSLTLKNVRLSSFSNKILYEKDLLDMPPKSSRTGYNARFSLYAIAYTIEDYLVPAEEVKNPENEYLLLEYDIEGRHYSEKLLRKETGYWLTRT